MQLPSLVSHRALRLGVLALLLCPAVAGAFPLPSRAVVSGVPFTVQAPFGNWRQPWQDFCEEASVVMAAHFVLDLPLTPAVAEQEMQIIRQYEELVYRRSRDTSADETAGILQKLYGLKNIQVLPVAASDDLKKELVMGRLVIIPVAGRLLKNPHFTSPGPNYHMVVVSGYDDARGIFITHDPGTRWGKGYTYGQKLLFGAIHDWNGGDVMRGEKKMIVVGK
ncbi:MAG: C39 family peptidase [bacterium]|nr:C39 family peptidase [bacterium]MDZ4299369.1 C39 family peptidase [Candidatus Sungbacteria bacterium]